MCVRARLQILEPSLIDQIVDEAVRVLEEIGILIDHVPSLDRLAAAGLRRSDTTGRVTFPPSIVKRALATAPSSIDLFDRGGKHAVCLEGDRVHFVPGSSALRILDHRTDEQRNPTTADFIEYVKVADGLQNLAYLSTAFVAADVPQQMADAWRLYLLLAHSERPFVSGAFTPDGVPRMARIMEMFRDGRDDLRARPMAIFTCCPNTPLRWGEDALRNLVDCAAWGIPIEVVPVLLLGMISPSTVVGSLVLHTAEVLSGLTIAQQIFPGCPVIFGGAPAAFHMQLMTSPMTSVEAMQVCCGYAQIADRLGLPSQAYLGLSDSKFNDLQAGAETATGAYLAALAGFNSVSGPGMLDYVNCFSLEKLVFDDELVHQVTHFLRPVEIKKDIPTMELLNELLAEKHLLTSEHTLGYWPEELLLPGPMIDRTNWYQWKQQGSKRLPSRAREVIDVALDEYQPKPLDASLHREIHDLFRAASPDSNLQLPRFDV
jgi:trimethylamine--corrinoid protein Co-methyltransferase